MNSNLMLYYLRVLHSRRLFSIDHVYLLPSHSYMVCDCAFGNIEWHLRHMPNLHIPDDYLFHIKQSVSRQYRVVNMTQANMLNFAVMMSHITKCKAPGSTFKDIYKVLFHLNYREGFLIQSTMKLRLMKGRAWTRAKFDLSTVPLPPL